VTASGFSDAVSTSPTLPLPPPKAVHDGAFGAATVAPPAAAIAKPTSDLEPASAVEILYKPRPEYTEEGRKRQIEGEVLLEALFPAQGEIQVQRLLRGLGYGLDESAMKAARAIRFRPALRRGLPIDSVAIIHITFQLAY
jgi:TonB family protein